MLLNLWAHVYYFNSITLYEIYSNDMIGCEYVLIDNIWYSHDCMLPFWFKGDSKDYKSATLPTSSILVLTESHGLVKSNAQLLNLPQKPSTDRLHLPPWNYFGYKNYLRNSNLTSTLGLLSTRTTWVPFIFVQILFSTPAWNTLPLTITLCVTLFRATSCNSCMFLLVYN